MLQSREKTRRRKLRMRRIRSVLLMLLSMIVVGFSSHGAHSEELPATAAQKSDTLTAPAGPIQSGPQIGSTIQQFFVRAVTGPHRNRSVCYVCRYGSRPVVLVFIQKTDPEIATLLKAIDAIVDENRVTGLRSFGVLVTDESAQAVPVLQTMAFDEQIRMPLTAATTAVAGPGCHNLHPSAATTVVLYRNQQSIRNFAFAKGEINKGSLAPLLKNIETLIDSDQQE
ncbi:MAG: hypothetical protein O3B86_05360 [Planctomycetota bacterium]|nr:hypothetical protein [Planctomycetota bacterium]